MSELPILSVSDFVSLVNQTLDFAYPSAIVEGEVSGYRVAKNKYVYFDLKDDEASINCFMTVYQLTIPIEEGMRLRVYGNPRLTQWGRLSLVVRGFEPTGEGSIKKTFELLRGKLEREGLFDEDRKRLLPSLPETIGVVTAADSAAAADFIKIVNARWAGLTIKIADTYVQGVEAPTQIVTAIEYFNQLADLPDVLVVIRGGGSPDDLAAFSTEPVVRAIAGSRIPTLVGVGHETDISLADLAADQRASTPSNAAEILVPDKKSMLSDLSASAVYLNQHLDQIITNTSEQVWQLGQSLHQSVALHLDNLSTNLKYMRQLLSSYDPRHVLQRGYALVRSGQGIVKDALHLKIGEVLMLELAHGKAKAAVKEIIPE